MTKYHTIIIGAGPSGMTAALQCAKDGQTVLLLDHCDKVGKKILVTGNGKCNLTNLRQDASCYRGKSPEAVGGVFSMFGFKETMDLFSELGIYTRDREGYVYPYNEQASSVREAFEIALEKKKNIHIETETSAKQIRATKNGFAVYTQKADYMSHTLILATGGLAGNKLGCDGSGYRFAKELGHSMIKPLPALTALKSKAPFLKKLSGVRNKARITLLIDEKPAGEETGELQWTDYGISGVAVFQLSRFAVEALENKKKVRLLLDFMPEMEEEALWHLLHTFRKNCGYKDAVSFLNGLFPKKLCPVLIKEAGLSSDDKIKQWEKADMMGLISAIKRFSLRISGYVGYEKAQVTQGGVPLEEVTNELESILCPGLFFAGEILDVDGTCGGYNLQWAFSSGSVAGRAAHKRNRQGRI